MSFENPQGQSRRRFLQVGGGLFAGAVLAGTALKVERGVSSRLPEVDARAAQAEFARQNTMQQAALEIAGYLSPNRYEDRRKTFTETQINPNSVQQVIVAAGMNLPGQKVAQIGIAPDDDPSRQAVFSSSYNDGYVSKRIKIFATVVDTAIIQSTRTMAAAGNHVDYNKQPNFGLAITADPNTGYAIELISTLRGEAPIFELSSLTTPAATLSVAELSARVDDYRQFIGLGE